MALPSNAPLDEVQFRREDVLAYWGGVHSNSIHGYFKESPFFDHTSRNGLLWEQGSLNQDTFELCANRARLEATLRAGTGLEFMVSGEPQVSEDPATQGPDSGVWVLRKQERTKTQRQNHDDLKVLGTYFAVGENLYQAPSVYDIVGNHLMSAMTSLNQFIDQAAALPIYNCSTGYSYVPDAEAEKDDQAPASRDASLAPAEITQPKDKAESSMSNQQISTSQARTAALLEQSLAMMRDHGDEFMNENPLLGEPGNFVFTHTKERIKARRAAEEEEAAAAAVSNAAAKSATASAAQTSLGPSGGTKSGSATPGGAAGGVTKAEATTSGANVERSERGSKSEASGGKKRKKSKVSTSGLRSESNSARNSPVLAGTSSPPAAPT